MVLTLAFFRFSLLLVRLLSLFRYFFRSSKYYIVNNIFRLILNFGLPFIVVLASTSLCVFEESYGRRFTALVAATQRRIVIEEIVIPYVYFWLLLW